MSDTELDVSSLGSGDEGVLVFQTEDTGGEDEWESTGEEGEEEEEEEEQQVRRGPRRTPPFLVVPEDDELER